MIELPHLEWTATAAQIENGFLPLHVSRLGPEALSIIRAQCPAHESAVRKIVMEALCGAHAQKIRLPHGPGGIRALLVIPMAGEPLWICTRHAKRIYELHDLFVDVGRSALVPWPLIPIAPIAHWTPGQPETSDRAGRWSRWARVLHDYEWHLSSLWSQCMVKIGAAGLSEATVVELTARLGIPLMQDLTRAAQGLLGSWVRGVRNKHPLRFYRSTSCLVRQRNQIQADEAFPMLSSFRADSRDKADPACDLLDLAIDRGQPLTETLIRVYGLSRPLINTLRFRWPNCAIDTETPFVDQLRRFAPLAPDALPRSGIEVQRLQRLLNHPLSDLSDAVLRSGPDGCSSQLRKLLRCSYADDLPAFATFLFNAASEAGIQLRDRRMSLQVCLGRPTLAQWLRATRKWRALSMRQDFLLGREVLLERSAYSAGLETWPVPVARPVQMDGFSFRFIVSVRELEREGEMMEHCARMLAPACASGKQCVAHVITPDGLPATLLLDSKLTHEGQLRYSVRQMSGPRNSEVAKVTRGAADRFAETLSQGLLDMDAAYHAWVTEPRDVQEPEADLELRNRRDALTPLIGGLLLHGPQCLQTFRGCFDIEGSHARSGWGSGSLFDFICTSITLALVTDSDDLNAPWRRLLR